MGQATFDGTLQRIADSPSLVLGVSQMSPWTLTGVSFGILVAVLVMLPKPAMVANLRRRSYAED